MAVSEYVASERRRAAVTKQKVTRAREEAVGSEQLVLGVEQQFQNSHCQKSWTWAVSDQQGAGVGQWLFLPYYSVSFCSY
jgi:hypothetical protein